MQRHLRSVIGLLLCGGVLLASAASLAAKHDHGKHAAQSSLLPACQGPSALPSPHCGRTPAAAFDTQGQLWLAFSQHGHVYLSHSNDQGKSFAPPRAVNPVPEAIYDDGENRPKLAIGPNDELYVSWTHKTPGRYSGDVRFSRSVDGGQHFATPVTINNDKALISHRFDALQVDGKGRIHLVWIDKRDQVLASQAGTPYPGAALYTAVSDDRGASFRPDRKLVDHSCECCRVVLDTDRDDRVVALWRHVFPVNMRDHAIAYLDQGPVDGQPTRATDDGWQVDGCPHHGPDLAVDDRNKAHLIWFSQGEKNRGLSYGRLDLDSGRMELTQSIDPTPAASRPQVIWQRDRLTRVWKSFDGEQTRLLASHSRDHGDTWSGAVIVASTAHASDHPQLVADTQAAYVGWHTQAEGFRLIRLTDDSAGGSTR